MKKRTAILRLHGLVMFGFYIATANEIKQLCLGNIPMTLLVLIYLILAAICAAGVRGGELN